MTYLMTLILGIAIGALLQDSFDLMFRIEHAWAKFNAWRKG
jgi:hypothetical protein